MSNPKETLRILYQALTDRPLDPQKDKDFYEPYVERLPDGDPMRELLVGIDYSESESLHLVSGQRGTGKSTELLRLKKLLEDEGYVVFYLNMLEYLSESEPVEITDFLLAATSGLAAQAKKKYQFDTIHESYWERMRNFLESEIELKNISGKSSIGRFEVDVQALLKRDPSFKRRLQKAARDHIVKLSENVQQFVIDLVRNVRNQPGCNDKQIVFIADSFEQIRGDTQNAEEVHDSMVRLFGSYGEHLHLPQLHFVITVPPYLTTAAPGITRLTGSNPVITWPSIHIRSKTDRPDEEARKIMRAIVHRRSPEAGTIFTESAINELAEASGGDLRHFFALLRVAILKSSAGLTVSFPISKDAIRQAKESLRRDLLPIPDDDVQWLHRVHGSKRVELPSNEQLPRLGRLFDNTLIISYRNGDNWYDIHPLIRDYVLERRRTLDERTADS